MIQAPTARGRATKSLPTEWLIGRCVQGEIDSAEMKRLDKFGFDVRYTIASRKMNIRESWGKKLRNVMRRNSLNPHPELFSLMIFLQFSFSSFLWFSFSVSVTCFQMRVYLTESFYKVTLHRVVSPDLSLSLNAHNLYWQRDQGQPLGQCSPQFKNE